MEPRQQLIIVNGKDQTDKIASYRYEHGRCFIIYAGSVKEYGYQSCKVQLLKLEKEIPVETVIVTAKGWQVPDLLRLEDFGTWYRVTRANGSRKSYLKSDVEIQENCLSTKHAQDLFAYFKSTAEAIGIRTKENVNILSLQYNKISSVRGDSVLANYFNPQKEIAKRTPPETIIYPFGLNQSQKVAIEKAFSSQISVIQGPPGTGKTQTILNIVANAVRNRKTVAVVSNNNAATMNVVEKLDKKGLAFLTAYLGSVANKTRFLEHQSQFYPDMSNWKLETNAEKTLNQEVRALSAEVNKMLDGKNRISEIEQELLQLKPEQIHFDEYYKTCRKTELPNSKLSSEKLMKLWTECENYAEQGVQPGFWKKLLLLVRFRSTALKLLKLQPEQCIPYLQNQFYIMRQDELLNEKQKLESKLKDYQFREKTDELTEKSLQLFRDELATSYKWHSPRQLFEKKDFWGSSKEFNREYPIVLSTTYSIKGTLSPAHLYDYLIIDEASQVDLATGVLALSCAKNVVIVGDQKQLPNVLDDHDYRLTEAIWGKYSLPQSYHYATHSLLSSALQIWEDMPVTLLREHYRCHPKIIQFCNQKFYQNQLIVMTEDHGEESPLTLFRTSEGNHARSHKNQRQIDVIREEVIPRLQKQGYHDIGIITPYRDQVSALKHELGEQYEIDTVHKFQGREKEAIVLTSVDNIITGFVDDPHMLNVAVSRAVKSLTVVTSQNPRNDRTNYGDLARYIAYQNCEIIDSKVYSVFDLLYKNYSKQRREFLKKCKRVSEYDSENLMFSVIEEILRDPEYDGIDCALHVSLSTVIRNYDLLNEDEKRYASNPLTHTDFLLFHRMDKTPVMAIEVDGTAFHAEGSRQAERDHMKNIILKKYGIPLLRIRTDESKEKERIQVLLKNIEEGNM